MNRFLQVVLGVIIAVHLLQVILLWIAFPLFYSNTRLAQPAKGSRLERRYSIHAGPVVFSRNSKSTASEVSASPYIGYKGMQPSIKMNNEYYLRGKQDQLVKVDFDPAEQILFIPVPDGKFNFLMVVVFILLLSYVAAVVYLSTQLYKFAGDTGKRHFFTVKNRRRMEKFGWFILLFGLCSYLADIFSVNILEGISGYHGILQNTTAGGIQHTYWLIAGLLLLIIAEAFGKGQQLQQEQDYTI